MELVESLSLRSGDLQMRNKGLYLDCANEVWEDLNETTLRLAERIKIPIRELYHINKRTNSIDLPYSFQRVSSVNIDVCGTLIPVFRNDSVPLDYVEVSAKKNCACAFGCGYKLCNSIKGYEVINHTETDSLPNGDTISFDCIDKKVVVGDILYTELQYPQRIYESGVWVNTVKHTENKKMCKLEVDKNGCVCDTEENLDAVCNACGIQNNDPNQCCIGGTASMPPNAECNTWQYYCTSKAEWFGIQCGKYPYFRAGCNNVYNISELGNRLVFPHNFGWDKVVVRFYADIDLNDLQIPYMAKETFMTGLLYFASTNNINKQQEAAIYGEKYSRQKWGLFLELNKYRMAEQRMILTPPVYVPSYDNNIRFNNWG